MLANLATFFHRDNLSVIYERGMTIGGRAAPGSHLVTLSAPQKIIEKKELSTNWEAS